MSNREKVELRMSKSRPLSREQILTILRDKTPKGWRILRQAQTFHAVSDTGDASIEAFGLNQLDVLPLTLAYQGEKAREVFFTIIDALQHHGFTGQ